MDRVTLAALSLTYGVGAFTAANQVRWLDAANRLQIETTGDCIADDLIALTGVGATFDMNDLSLI